MLLYKTTEIYIRDHIFTRPNLTPHIYIYIYLYLGEEYQEKLAGVVTPNLVRIYNSVQLKNRLL